MYNMLFQSHSGLWEITILLFIISFILLKMGKPKSKKITQMILRLFYVIMIISGLGMLITLNFPWLYVIKGILALWLIWMMELILSKSVVRKENGPSTKSYWTQFIIALVLVVLIAAKIISF
ncbi:MULTISPECIES: DUF1516 family protein [Bacillaceae]|uniref:DUF1516 family protein n=1 Tax=Bacillaceae TaxID=186817 RepID=UPI0009884A1E|nr:MULTISPECIES: DUF1516 family protein [Bacillaceae]MBO0994606.1 DUF1516 family protein [Bacillus sp. SD088]